MATIENPQGVVPTSPAITPGAVQQDTMATLQAAPVMNTNQAGAVLNQYGIDPAQALTSPNIVNTLTRPTAAPDDLLGIRGQLNYDLGLTEQQNKLNDLKSQYYKAPSIIEGQRLNMSVLRGETGLAQDKLSASIQSQADTVNSLVQERDYRMGIAEKNLDFTKQLKLQYAGAGIKYGDSMDSIEKKLVNYTKENEKKAKKDAYKSALMELGIKTSGSLKDLEKRLRKAGKDKKKQADSLASIQIQSAQAALDNVRSQIAERNAANSTANEDVSQYYGTVQTPTGGVSTNNPSAYDTSGSNGWSATLNPNDNPNNNSSSIDWSFIN